MCKINLDKPTDSAYVASDSGPKLHINSICLLGFFFKINVNVPVLVSLSCPQSMHVYLQLRKLLLLREPYNFRKKPLPSSQSGLLPWDVNQPSQNLHFNPLENLDTKLTWFTMKVTYATPLETQQVLICYINPHPADFLDQGLVKFGYLRYTNSAPLKVNRKTIWTNKIRNLRVKHNKEWSKNPNLTKISPRKPTVLFGCTIRTQWKKWQHF